ncbi:MAG: amidohydrolase family protein [Gammaproteobacteria bacterium]|nr:amidohydrolase family protein [Gammaproteobacteria bacterium]
MPHYLTDEELKRVKEGQKAAPRTPIPTRMISNGEFSPLPQSPRQQQFEARINEIGDREAKRHGMTRRGFFGSAAGLAAAFVAMNDVFGPVFDVQTAEAKSPEMADARAARLAGQFVFDDQTHFVHDGFAQEGLLGLGLFAADHWNKALDKEQMTLAYYKFENYIRQIFLASDTKVALLSGAPFDDPSWWMLPNEQIRDTVDLVNRFAGSRRMLGHFVVTPRQKGWMEGVDKAIEELHPASWKLYTVGDPLSAATQYPYRLDDEALMYPFYEKAVKAGINTMCIHKGLMPADYETSWKDVWKYNTHWDIAKAAKDWPQMNFVIYHSCLRPFLESPDAVMAHFEKTGEIEWATDLARLPAEHGLTNVYPELGTSFANSATANPRFAAALLGTLVKGFGPDRIMWGTDSVFYGSPQWQIEALRRIEIPEDMQKKHGFAPLGAADGLVKSAILGLNGARLYGMDMKLANTPFQEDHFVAIRQEYEERGGIRDNAVYGYIA